MKYLLVFFQFLSFSGEALAAGDLRDLRAGTDHFLDDLLKQGQILIYTKKNCSSCRRYLDLLKTCSKKVRDQIIYISMDSPAQARNDISRKDMETPLYIVLKKGRFSFLKGTPTTQSRNFLSMGIMTCAELEDLTNSVVVGGI